MTRSTGGDPGPGTPIEGTTGPEVGGDRNAEAPTLSARSGEEGQRRDPPSIACYECGRQDPPAGLVCRFECSGCGFRSALCSECAAENPPRVPRTLDTHRAHRRACGERADHMRRILQGEETMDEPKEDAMVS